MAVYPLIFKGQILLLILLPALLLATGCVGRIWNIGPAGATPGLVYSDVVYPNEIEEDTDREIPYDTDTIQIVEWVETGRLSTTISGRLPGYPGGDLLGIRDSGYVESYRRLVTLNRLDGLLNSTVDTERFSLNLFVFRIYWMRTEIGGLGYRFRDPDKPFWWEAEEIDGR